MDFLRKAKRERNFCKFVLQALSRTNKPTYFHVKNIIPTQEKDTGKIVVTERNK